MPSEPNEFTVSGLALWGALSFRLSEQTSCCLSGSIRAARAFCKGTTDPAMFLLERPPEVEKLESQENFELYLVSFRWEGTGDSCISETPIEVRLTIKRARRTSPWSSVTDSLYDHLPLDTAEALFSTQDLEGLLRSIHIFKIEEIQRAEFFIGFYDPVGNCGTKSETLSLVADPNYIDFQAKHATKVRPLDLLGDFLCNLKRLSSIRRNFSLPTPANDNPEPRRN